MDWPLGEVKLVPVPGPENEWKNVRQSASKFRGSIGGSSLPLRVGFGVFFLLVLGPLILSGVLALAIAVACAVLVALVQRLVVFYSGIFTTRRGQGRKNVRVVRREKT